MARKPFTTMNYTTDGTAAPWERWLCRAPLLAAAALICLFNGINLDRLVRADAPRNPWEATEIVESWRYVRGLPVYDSSPDGHSTHVYGALAPYVQGAIFRWVGLNNVSGRLLSLFSALATVTLLAVAMRGERLGWWAFAITWAILLGVNFRSWEYFAENRPDMTALMFSALGVLAMGYGQEARRRWLMVLGTLCVVAGFFFKQTAAIFSVVPMIALVLRGRRPTRAEVLLALLPFATMVGVIAGLRVFLPTVYYYMIVVPKAFPLHGLQTLRSAWDLLVESPLFLVLLGEWLMFDMGSYRRDPRLWWLAAVLIVTIPFSALTAAKAGGTYNSLLPGLFALMAFCALRLPRLMKSLENHTSGLPSRLMVGTFLSLLVLMTAFPRPTTRHSLLTSRSPHDQAYWRLVNLVKGLPGKVICPEDPTIPLYAVGDIGLNIFSEYDTHLVNGRYPATPPGFIRKEILGADYLVDVQAPTQDALKDSHLQALGFEQVKGIDALIEASDYKIWRRKGAKALEVVTSRSDGTAAPSMKVDPDVQSASVGNVPATP
jgi:hypothetical protein